MDRRWETRGARRTERAIVAVGLASAAIAVVVLIGGWVLDVPSLRSIVPGLATMKVNTTVGFVLIGVALPLVVTNRLPRLAQALASTAALLGAATVVQYVAGVDLGIDQLLRADPYSAAPALPGRMGLNTAVCFTGLGVATALVAGRRGWPRLLAQVLAALVLALAGVALTAYLLAATGAGDVFSVTAMAVHTAVLFVLLAGAVGAATADTGALWVLTLDERAGRIARRVVPVVVLIQVAVLVVVQVAVVVGLIDDQGLELALVWAGALAASTLIVLRSLANSARKDRVAAAVARDRDALLAAFTDLHVRVGTAGELRSVHGDTARHGLPGTPPGTVDELPGPAGEAVRRATARARVEHGGRTTYETVDGRAFEVRAVALPGDEVALSIGDVSALVGVQRDLQALNERLEDEVADRTAELAASNRELERFAYLASHDLQEPLRMITGFVGKIETHYGDQLDDRGRRYLGFAVDGAQRMSGLIEGLLAYSRAGRISIDRVVPTSLSGLVAEAMASLGPQIETAAADVTVEVEDVEVTAEPALLRQVVQNLVANAVKFHRPGTTPQVTIVGRRAGATLTLVVEDDGIGIPLSQRHEVFTMFRRVSVDPTHAGTGIGLSLVQQIVHAHGGTIDIEDPPGGTGTRVRVTMPADGSGVVDQPSGHTGARPLPLHVGVSATSEERP